MDPILEIVHPTDLDKVYTVQRAERKGLEFSNVIPGGDHHLTFSMPCDVVGTKGEPPLAGDVVLRWGDQHVWEGILTSRTPHRKNGILTGLMKFEAIGYYRAWELKRLRSYTSYGPPILGGSPLSDKVNIVDIRDIIAHVYGQCAQSLFNYDSSLIGGSGITLAQDSQTFAGNTALDVMNFVSVLVSYLSNPNVWQVKPREVGGFWEPYLYFQAMESVPRYWDDATGDVETEFTQDITRHPNVVTVEWGNKQRWTAPLDDLGTVDYTTFGGRPIELDKWVRFDQEYQGLDDIEALARGYLSVFKNMRSSGSVTVRKPIRASDGIGGYIQLDPILMRSGYVIENMTKPTADPLDDPQKYITEMAWREDSCTTSLTVGEATDLYKEIRRLAVLPNKTLSWAIAFGGLSIPGGSYNGVTPIIGQEFTNHPTDTTVRVGTVTPTAALTDGNHDFGPGGGKILPENVPTRFVGPMQQFRMTDGSVLPSGIPAGVNVCRAICLNWKGLDAYQVVSKEAATASIRINKNGTQVALCSLSASTNSNIQTIGSGPFSTVQGDVLTYDIVTNDVSTDLTVICYGEADHPGYPTNPHPDPT